MMVSNGQDPLVVRTEEFALVLEVWIKDHEAHHPPESRRITSYTYVGDADKNIPGYSGAQYIAQFLHNENGERAIYRILKRETRVTTLQLVDSILTAIEEVAALTDGRLTVIPNPYWTQERWLKWKEEQGCI